ncbi:hypothetical protein [Nocardiopsis dassonvillei]|uniref:hypothetical protein n=1 Tax=Nocardiopsis dassonvillei TaxID=2014 RepID=UPI00363B5A2F
MATRAVLRGYLLEESLAWLIRSSGYRLLANADQDPVELVSEGSNLSVRGRGAVHQVDVLGEFGFTPAFSLPVRLFLEAKYYKTPCRLQVVRNAHGVLHDVNENFVDHPGTRPRRRYRYSYALFSANGFTDEAQRYALAHQISLVDLSGGSFAWLHEALRTTAQALFAAQDRYPGAPFPVAWMRSQLRTSLETAGPGTLPPVPSPASKGFEAVASQALHHFVTTLRSHESQELLLGFPAAPFILPLAVNNRQRFLEYANAHPNHPVRIHRRGNGDSAEWTLSPHGETSSYQASFTLPDHVEAWISGTEDKERQRAQEVKKEFLAEITVYCESGSGMRSYQLRYQPSALSRR